MNSSEKKKYDTNINIIGSIKNLDVIRKALSSYFSEQDSINSLIVERNEFIYNTYKTTTRIASGIESSFLKFRNQKHKDVFEILFSSNYTIELLNYALLLQFSLNNNLFDLITKDVFIKIMNTGRINIKSEDIYCFLINALENKTIDNVKWSQTTIKIIPNKYLNFLAKLGYIEEKTKAFKNISPSSACFYLFLLVSDFCTDSQDIFKSPILPLSFLSKESIISNIKYFGQKEYIDMNYNGEALNVYLKDNIKEVFDDLSK